MCALEIQEATEADGDWKGEGKRRYGQWSDAEGWRGKNSLMQLCRMAFGDHSPKKCGRLTVTAECQRLGEALEFTDAHDTFCIKLEAG